MKKIINGIIQDMTSAEIAQRNAEIAEYNAGEFDRSIAELRSKRDRLLAATDYLALSDQTLSAEMSTYRQALRDITNNLTTVSDVDNVTFPNKPE